VFINNQIGISLAVSVAFLPHRPAIVDDQNEMAQAFYFQDEDFPLLRSGDANAAPSRALPANIRKASNPLSIEAIMYLCFLVYRQ